MDVERRVERIGHPFPSQAFVQIRRPRHVVLIAGRAHEKSTL